MNLTDVATFLVDLVKRAKYIFDHLKKNPCDTKRHIREIAINNGCNTHFVHILREKRDGNFLFKGKFLSRLQKTVVL